LTKGKIQVKILEKEETKTEEKEEEKRNFFVQKSFIL